MADKSGLIIGQMQGKPSYWEGVAALFSRRLEARDAVTTFLQSCQGRIGRKPQSFLRLTRKRSHADSGPHRGWEGNIVHRALSARLR